MATIKMQDFQKLLEKNAENPINIIDIRARDVFEMSHIKGAMNIPLDKIEEQLINLDKDKEYYIICYSGNFSEQATAFLIHHGFRAINVQSGMNYILEQR